MRVTRKASRSSGPGRPVTRECGPRTTSPVCSPRRECRSRAGWRRGSLQARSTGPCPLAAGLSLSLAPAFVTATRGRTPAFRRGPVRSAWSSRSSCPIRRLTKTTFPMRNAVMSGYTAATVVVEAHCKSGARMQARLALEYGRHVFLLESLLVNDWAREYAKRPNTTVVRSVNDVLGRIESLLTEIGRAHV